MGSSAFYILACLLAGAGAQSPGPDWPSCEKTSTTYHPGWEILNLRYQPPEERSWVATAYINIQNAADGSRILCDLSRNVTSAEADAAIVLDNSDGLCVTAWAGKYDSVDESQYSPDQAGVEIALDVSTGELSVRQKWTCHAAGTEPENYTGKATGSFEYGCAAGREGEPTACSPDSLYLIGEPPLFLGPAEVTRSDTPDGSGALDIQKQEDCELPAEELDGWQILQMGYTPPTPQPEDSPYKPVSVRVELRNLNDGSRTLCYLNSDDISAADQGILLDNEGAVLGDGNYEHGCWTGWFDLVKGDNGTTAQEWRWLPTANVTFHTKTLELGVEQSWPCGGVEDAYRSSGSRELEMECTDTGNSMVPTGCEPREALWSESGPVIVVGGEK